MELLREIQSTNVAPGSMKIWSLAGTGFVLKTSQKLIMIDPYLDVMPEGSEVTRRPPLPFSPDNIDALDILVSTHEHEDHCDRVTVEAVGKQTDAIFVGPHTSTGLALAWGYPKERIHTVRAGDSLSLDGVEILTLECFDPSCPDGNIYLIRTEGIHFLHCGDSFNHEKFNEYAKKFAIDIACISTAVNPPGRQWYMNAQEACEAAARLQAKVFVPMHWNIWHEAYLPPDEIRAAAEAAGMSERLVLIDMGESFVFTK